jgi:hypothetical protein
MIFITQSSHYHIGEGPCVIMFYTGADVPLFLLNVFGEGDKIDLSPAERNELRKELAGLAEDYRRGVHHHVQRG